MDNDNENDNSNDDSTWFERLKTIITQTALLIGVFGGVHSFTQMFAYYFGQPIQMTIPQPW